MTKIVKPSLSFIFITGLILNYYIFININNNTITTFNESNSDMFNYSNYLLDFKNTLNTKNFNKKISILEKKQYKIKMLYMNVNKTWDNNLIEKISEYSFDNINNFIKYYKEQLKNHNLIEEVPNIDIFGIKISRVLIYTSKENIEKLVKSYNITYEKK